MYPIQSNPQPQHANHANHASVKSCLLIVTVSHASFSASTTIFPQSRFHALCLQCPRPPAQPKDSGSASSLFSLIVFSCSHTCSPTVNAAQRCLLRCAGTNGQYPTFDAFLRG